MTIDDLIPEEEDEDDLPGTPGVTESTLGKTEQKAYEYLKDSGYEEDTMCRSGTDQIPDFVCNDELYEAKRAVKNNRDTYTVRIGPKQADVCNKHDPMVLVFTDEDTEPRFSFRWSERDNTSIEFTGAINEGKKRVCSLISSGDHNKILEYINENRLDSKEHAIRRGITLLLDEMEEQNRDNPW